MKTIAEGSPRLLAARRFGDALKAAMARRQVGQGVLAQAAGVGRSAVVQWRMGRNLPTLETARRLADALGDDHLVAICRQGRTLNCSRCGREFLHDGGGPRSYCSELCLRVAQKLRVPDGRHPRTKLAEARHQLKAVQADAAAVSVELAGFQAAVGAMCQSCEPEGYCRTPECALRPVSPLQLRVGPRLEVEEAEKAEGVWGKQNRERQLLAIRAANERRWARDGQRQEHSQRMQRRFASMTEADRQAWIERIRQGRCAGIAARQEQS